MAIGGTQNSNDHLGSFRKMRDEGMIAPDEYKKLAGLVPLPETEVKAEPEETGVDALSEAAKAALQKAAAKKPENSVIADEELNDDQRGQSTES